MTVSALSEVAESVRRIGERQHGVILGSQIGEAGMSRAVLTSLRSQGWLSQIRPGAYTVGGSPPSLWQQAVAVALLGGGGSTLSHYTAARVHRLAGIAAEDRVHLTVVRPRHPRLSGVSIHRVASLSPLDRLEYRGIGVTAPARTLVDLAPDLSTFLLARCLDEGLLSGLWDLGSVQAAVERAGNRSGVVRLRAVLEERISPPNGVDLEARVIRALRCFGPFEVQYQVVAEGRVFVLDIAWPHCRVAVESDGWDARRRSRSKFDHDRRRGNILAAHGWTVVHLTSAMSDDEMRAAVFQVLVRVGSRTGSPGPA